MDNSKNSAASDPLAVMLEARSVAVVGASARPDSLGARMIDEVAKSPCRPRTYLVNPRYGEIGGIRCYPGLAELPEPVDLALLAVPDAALEGQVRAAALPAGPVALVTHSGSVFSALLRTRRAFGFTLAVSSGQELVTPAAAYARYALTLPETRVLALVLEAIRDATALRAALAAGPLPAADLFAVLRDYGIPAVAARMLAPLRVTGTLSGLRGGPVVSLDAVIAAIVAFSTLATDLGDQLSAFDVNPLICAPGGPIAVDALVVTAMPGSLVPTAQTTHKYALGP